MKKFYNFLSFTWLVALAILLSTGGVQAQLAPQYPLTISTGTYSSISGTGTSVTTGDDVGTNITGLTGFTVNGVTYTNARMCSNGWLALYTIAPTVSGYYTPLSTAMTDGAVIFAPYGRNLNNNNGGTAWWQQVGNELVFEWKDFNRYGYTDVLNFQIRLNTSTGEIKFVYGTMTPAASTSYPQVGWKTNGTVDLNWSTDINNVMIDVTGSPNTCNWSNVVTGNANTSTCYFNSANSGVVPASGLTYSWTKPNGTDPNPVRTFSAVSGITTSTATLTWTAPTGATQYNVQYRAIGSCTWTNFSGNPVSSNSATLTGLSPATTYQIRVQSGNGSVNGLWSHIPNQAGTGSGYVASGTFTTACAAIVSLPWTEGFESATLPNLPSTCWLEDPSFGDWVTTNNSSSTYDADARTGAQFLRDSWSATNEFVWTPGFALTSGQSYDFSFWWAGDTYSGWTGDIFYNTIQSGTGATQMGSSFVTSSTTTTKTYVQEKRTFVAPTTGTYYFAVRVNATSSPWYLSFDDFRFEQTPSCLATTATAASNITATTASANWSTATGSWIIEYGPTATFGTPGTGATAGNGNNTVVTASNVSTKGLTGLTPATGYSYVVRQDCSGGGNGYSANSNVITFTTAAACPATTATAASNITGTTASANWSTATGSWIIEYGPTATFGTPGTGATAGNVNNTVVTASNVSTISLSGLTASTGYSYVVRQDCSGSGNGYSANSNVITFTTSQIPAILPYTQNFASNDFGFVNGTQTNKWAYGTATGNPANAIYVSNDGGTTNAYTVTSASVVHAYRDIAIPSGSTNATFNFDWKGFGESSYDYLRVWLVPTSFIPTAGTQITAGSGRIQVGGNLNQQSSWQTYSNSSLDVSTFAGQTMRLVFEWRNDASAGTNPPAAVDNINFNIPTCLATTATAASNITGTTASANWSTATGSWIIEYGPTATFGTPGTGATAGNVNNTVVTASNVSTIGLTGLTASTGYSYVVRQDCSGGGNGYSANSNVITFTTAVACPATTATAASNITGTTASANWSTVTGSWIIEYGPTATFGTPGTGATAGNVNNTVVTASNVSTIGLTGLTPATGYSYVVRQDCSGGGNGYSANSNVITFTTACNAVTSFPWAESFDNASLPTCWTQQYVSGTLNWATVTTNGNSTITPHSGARMAEFRNTTTGSATRLVTPLLDLTLLTNPELTFYFANVNWLGDIDELRVYYSTDGGSNWTLIPGQTYTTEHATWQEVKVILPSPNSTYMVAFEGTSNYARGLDLDDVSIAEAPSCLATTATAATNITATTASANWSTATGSWIIEYGPTATFGTPGTGATAGNGNNTVVTASGVSTIGLTGLTASTGYSYVVRQDCSGSGNGYSANSNVITFTTACNAVTTFPFIETFEDDSDSRDCWLNDYVSGNLPWALTDGDQGNGSVNSAHSGVLNAIFWQGADNGYETRLVSPSFDFTGKSKLYLDFYYANEEWTPSQSELRIYYKVGAGAWTLIPGAEYTTSVNAWTFVHLDLPSSDNASDYKIAFHGKNQWSYGIVVDDVLINAKPDDCANALGISSDPVTDYINPGTQFMSNATKSSVPDGSCFTTSPSSKDMWYKITTNGDNGSVLNLTVTPDASMDVALTLFDGTCGTLNAVACSNANSAGVAENMVYTLPLWDGGIEVRANKVYFLRVTDIGGNGTSFTIGNNGSTALPLTLLSFKAQQVKRGEVLLDWRVKDEVNMKQYDVQRSVDGKNFTTIGTVNNLGKEVYTLIDQKPAQGINYYRLSMVEASGLTNYSHIVAININDGKALHASPNPVTGDLTVEVKGEVGKQAVIDIIDYTGNKVRTVAIPAGKVTVDMTSLPTGVYVVQYIDGTTVYTTRVVKM